MSLAFIPVYIKYLGIEAYGLISIFVLLQVWLTLLDMGIRPALFREMALFYGGGTDDQYIWNLLRSVELITLGIAALVGIGIWMASGWLANNWVQVDQLSIRAVTSAFSFMGFIAALRFVESIYISSIDGLQLQVTQNIITATMATIRGLGAVLVLKWVSPTIETFFIWQALVSLVTVLILMVTVYRNLPSTIKTAHFSLKALNSIWRFAAGMMCITFLALVLSHTDKILLSRYLSLEAFGYYALAATVGNGLYHLIIPIGTAFYPRFTELITQQNSHGLIKSYHLGSQLIAVLVGSAGIVLAVFAERILFLWTADLRLTQEVAPVMTLLALGTLLNGLMWMPVHLQFAHGWTTLLVQINTLAAVLIVPTIFFIVPLYGPIGVAWIWVLFNAAYCVTGVHFMHRRILKEEKKGWYFFDTLIPLTSAAIIAGLLKYIVPDGLNRFSELGLFLLVIFFVLIASSIAAPLVRLHLGKIIFGVLVDIKKKWQNAHG